jgi:hypothetical protein
VKHEIVTMPAQIEQLKADLQSRRPEQRDSIQKIFPKPRLSHRAQEHVNHSLTMTFDRSLIFHRKPARLKLWLGRAHTDGDVSSSPRKKSWSLATRSS